MLRAFLIVAMILISSGCAPDDDNRQGLITQPPEQMVEHIRRLPLDQKIQFYLHAMEQVRPRPVALAVEIAQGGADTARVVGRSIRISNDNKERNDLLVILLSMKDMGIFDSCNVPSIRQDIMPRDYTPEDAEGQLIYALAFIDLCLHPPRSVAAPGARQ